MKKIANHFICVVILGVLFAGGTLAQYQMETLGRGVIAVKRTDGIYVGWRLLATDPDRISFNVYRGDTKVNDAPIEKSTNLLDTFGTVGDTYRVVPVLDGIEQAASETVMPWNQNVMTVSLRRPTGGTTPDGVSYSYSPNDCSVGDLDGDGEYEIVVKWDPSNSKDNSQSGHTGNVYLDAYKMDGSQLWRIDLGKNIRAGAHYTQFMVYDLDGDGKAELACKTADGTIDGIGTVIGDSNADYRNSGGYILSGPEFFTIFSGQTGQALQTVDYLPARGNVSSWGDSQGNRVDRFLACIAYLDGARPSVVMCRGYYTRTVLVAWDWRDGQLTHRWTFDSNIGYPTYTGQGNHNLSVADVDFDGKDEIIYGSMAIDDDGSGLWNARLGHGDAMHVSDIDPDRPGLEVWGIHEQAAVGSALLEARTGEIIWGTGPADVGRGTAGNLIPSIRGMECWGGTDGLRNCKNIGVGNSPSSTNHVIWWDGDLGRELLDSNYIQKYNGPALLLASGCSSNNGTKSNPCLQADLMGDWREEVIFRTNDNSAIRIYTTTDTTTYRITTLMHDRVYREGIAWQNVAYNQPPHTSFYIGEGMFTPDSLVPPAPPYKVVAIALSDTVILSWEPNMEPDLAGYNVYRSRRQNGEFTKLNIELLIEAEYTDTDVKNDTTYFYKITAIDTDGNESGFSDVISATPTLRPDPPINLSIRNDKYSIKIWWEIADTTNLKEVRIYSTKISGSNYLLKATVPISQTYYIDTSLASSTTWYYVLTTVENDSTESFYSREINATTGATMTLQAEDGVHGGVVYLDSNHLGFNGTGFVNFEKDNSSVEFTDVPGFGGGEMTLVYRYALGNTSRTGSLIVNGIAKNLTMNSTVEWTTWVLDSTGITLQSGFGNTIRFETTGADFGNLDEITIYAHKITGIDLAGNRDFQIPASYQLSQNYPNPFNPETHIQFDLPEATHVRIDIFDLTGRLVTTLIDADYLAGSYNVIFNGFELASGMYLARSQMNRLNVREKARIFTRKLILLK